MTSPTDPLFQYVLENLKQHPTVLFLVVAAWWAGRHWEQLSAMLPKHKGRGRGSRKGGSRTKR